MSLYIYTINLRNLQSYYELLDISVSAYNWEQAKERFTAIWKQNYLERDNKYFDCSMGLGVRVKVDEAIEMLKDMKEDDERVKKQEAESFYLESAYSE